MISIVLIAVVAAVLAWMVIPSARKADLLWRQRWRTIGPIEYHQQGPFAASVEEKMAIVESELRQRQSDKYRKQVIDEVAELVTSTKAK
jgi:hypothetical protein